WGECGAGREGGGCGGGGEPVHEGLRAAALVECHQHETLVNRAFAGADLRVLCPYSKTQPESVLARARANHPWWAGEPNPGFDARHDTCTLAQPLPEPFAPTTFLRFDVDGVTGVPADDAGRARRLGPGADT